MSPLSPGPRALFRSRERYGLRRLLDVVDGTPRWAVLAAYGTVVSVLPSAVWRTAVGFGADLGMPHVIGAVSGDRVRRDRRRQLGDDQWLSGQAGAGLVRLGNCCVRSRAVLGAAAARRYMGVLAQTPRRNPLRTTCHDAGLDCV
jgi:hypothetical protein